MVPAARALFFSCVAFAAATAAAAKLDVGPYLQDPRADGAMVVWETDSPTVGEVVVALPPGERRFASPLGTHHEVRVAGLPSGRYVYRLDGDVPSPGGELATAALGDRFTFVVYGDNRDRDAEHARVVAAMEHEHADFLLNTGDLTGDGGEELLWRRFFAIEQPLLAGIPLYPALGNHELVHDPGATHFSRYFVLPGPTVYDDAYGDGGVPSATAHPTERYYSFRYANALFVALDGNQSHGKAQAEWVLDVLDAAAADRAVRHIFVFFHQPPFSVGDFCGSAAEQGLWVPEFERRGVRAVFTGHDHSYQRLERNGIRYFVTGGGGASLHHQTAHCPEYDLHAARKFVSAYHYLRVRVRGDQADLDAVSVDGEVIDSVRLHEPPPPATPAPEVPYRDPPLRAPGAAARPTASSGVPVWIGLGFLFLAVVGVALVRMARRR